MERAKDKMLKADPKFKKGLTIHHDINRCTLHIITYMTGKQVVFKLLTIRGFLDRKNIL